MMWFLIVYDRPQQRMTHFRAYASDEYDIAWRARNELSLSHVRDPDVEVVLLGASSEADVRVTHARYFQPPLTVADGK